MRILAIESSCDDTAAAVLEVGDTKDQSAPRFALLSNALSNQNQIHARFGGIVPELASRSHTEAIWPMVDQALRDAESSLDDIDLIAATQGPGLVGSLLVGFTFAKSIALVRGLPCVGVDHMAGHLLACLLEGEQPSFPYTALVVSGGNTSLFSVQSPYDFQRLGRTRDDAAGEAFDKVARLLGLGYPGGPVISEQARNGNPAAIAFPRSWLGGENPDFSFSGLKTSVVNYVHHFKQKNKDLALPVADICASFQEAVVEVLARKTVETALRNGHHSVVIGGGVAANARLREQLKTLCQKKGLRLYTPSPTFCTDNAAMIAVAGYYAFQEGNLLRPDSDAYSRSPLN